MHLRPPPRAFDPFIRHTATVVCRLGTRVYKDTLQVGALTGGTPTGSAGSNLQPATADAITIIIRVADWRSEFPPALGTKFESEQFHACTVQSVQRVADRWHLHCTRNQKARST